MDILEVSDELSKAHAEHDDFDAAIADDAHMERSQKSHAAYVRALFPALSETHLKYLLWPQPTIQGVCL